MPCRGGKGGDNCTIGFSDVGRCAFPINKWFSIFSCLDTPISAGCSGAGFGVYECFF